MKAKHFKKLRKRVAKIQKFKVRETFSLFGDFFGNNRMCWVKDDVEVTASDPIRAIKIYMRRYEKENKQRSNNYRTEYTDTTERWGTIMVTDEKGYRYFFN